MTDSTVLYKHMCIGLNYFSSIWKLMKDQASLKGNISNHSLPVAGSKARQH
jgi:hypothetical protein